MPALTGPGNTHKAHSAINFLSPVDFEILIKN